jgi:hypothetical protein
MCCVLGLTTATNSKSSIISLISLTTKKRLKGIKSSVVCLHDPTLIGLRQPLMSTLHPINPSLHPQLALVPVRSTPHTLHLPHPSVPTLAALAFPHESQTHDTTAPPSPSLPHSAPPPATLTFVFTCRTPRPFRARTRRSAPMRGPRDAAQQRRHSQPPSPALPRSAPPPATLFTISPRCTPWLQRRLDLQRWWLPILEQGFLVDADMMDCARHRCYRSGDRASS